MWQSGNLPRSLTHSAMRPSMTVLFRVTDYAAREVMAVPKRRASKSRKGHRRSHHHVTPVQVQYCPKCNEPVLPHRLCPNCGSYQGREVVNMEEAEKGK